MFWWQFLMVYAGHIGGHTLGRNATVNVLIIALLLISIRRRRIDGADAKVATATFDHLSVQEQQ